MTIALAQYPVLPFADMAAWRNHLHEWISEAARNGAQLLLFPEYGSMCLSSLTDRSIQHDLHAQIIALQAFSDDFVHIFQELAKRFQVVIAAPSFPVNTPAGVLNRAFVFGPNGMGYQDKWMMTRFEKEIWQIQAAPRRLALFECKWGCFGIQICYDVEFHLGARLLAAHGAQLILAPSCTETLRGATRVHVGARARALENQCFVAVSQTVGEAPWSPAVDLNYGWAALYGPPDIGFPESGILTSGQPQDIGWVYGSLDFRLIEQVRTDGQVLNFRDQTELMSLKQFPDVIVHKISI